MGTLRSLIMVLVLAAAAASAQTRIPCDRTYRDNPERALTRADDVRKWEGKVVIPVLLMAFPDVGFSVSDEDIVAYWNDMLNKPGYNEHGAHGSVADYFRQQSSGIFEPVFEIIGPVTVPEQRAYYGENRNGKRGEDKHAPELIRDACVAAGIDWKVYDYNADGDIDILLTVFAGPGENREGPADAIWPHKTRNYLKVGDVYVGDYTCVSELNNVGQLDGYGTFVHEFSHCLLLPDLYPVTGDEYSIFDEWDLMDGGNYANGGFSPPNYSAFERYLCGWLEPKELSSETDIIAMPSLDEAPEAYIIYNDAYREEYYLLENRQQRGFDTFVPGNGLLVTHVCNYSKGTLAPNTANRTQVGLVAADNRTYRQCESYFGPNRYGSDGRCLYLSLAAYPLVVGDVLNDSLTDHSVPAASLKKANAAGAYFLSKPITNIRQDDEGHISFSFMKTSTSILSPVAFSSESQTVTGYFDLQGRRLPSEPSRPGIYVIRFSDGSTKKFALR